MLNNTSEYNNFISDISSEDPLKKTEAVFCLNKINLDYEDLILFFKSENIDLIHYGLTRFDKIQRKEDSSIFLSFLKHSDSRIRELSSLILLNHISDPEYNSLFNNNEAIEVFIECISDSNPRVCKNISYSLQHISKSLTAAEKLVKIIKSNFNTFTVYWGLFALENLLIKEDFELNSIENQILELLSQTSNFKEYQVRERSAHIVNLIIKKYKKKSYNTNNLEIINSLSQNLKNDDIFYVKNAISQ